MHWDALLKARAIENQMFLIGVNRIGEDGNGLEYVETTKIYDPLGELVKPYKITNKVKFYDLDLNLVMKTRKGFRTIESSEYNAYIPYLQNDF